MFSDLEHELAERKEREEALVEREEALAKREEALVEREEELQREEALLTVGAASSDFDERDFMEVDPWVDPSPLNLFS